MLTKLTSVKYNYITFLRYFLFAVFCFVFIHLFSYLPTNKISNQENRTLAQRPSIFISHRINEHIGSETESWLQDQFPYRENIIKAHFKMMYNISGRVENNKAFTVDNGWMFEKWTSTKYSNIASQKSRLNKIKKAFKIYNKLVKSRNISTYIVLIPLRSSIYRKMYEDYYKPYPMEDFVAEVLKVFRSFPDFEVIYPYEEMIELSLNEPVYHMQDAHLTEAGAKLLQHIVFQKLKTKFFPDKEIEYGIRSNPVTGHSIAALLGLKKGKATSYGFTFDFNNISFINKRNYQLYDSYFFEETESTNPVIYRNLYMFGICYEQTILFPLLRYVFQNTKYYLTNDDSKKFEEFNQMVRYALSDIEDGSVVIFTLPVEIGDSTTRILINSLGELQ